MKSLYLDCGMGIAEDIFMAALLDIHPLPEDFIKRLNYLGIPWVEIQSEETTKYGITGTQVNVLYKSLEETRYEVNLSETYHSAEVDLTPLDIKSIIASLPLSQKILNDIEAVLNLIFEAEKIAGEVPSEGIYPSKFGNIDALVYVTGSCMLLEELAFEKILASPIHVGNGKTRYKSGFVSIPSPVTSYILRDIPHYQGNVIGELCTPVGAALMRHFVDGFVPFANMKISKTGHGIGSTDFKMSSCLRAMCGENY